MAQLSWYRIDESTWALALLEPCDDLQGLRLSGVIADRIDIEITGGVLLDMQATPVFLQNAGGLDIGLAVLGSGRGIVGDGELFRVTTSQPVDLSAVNLTARSSDNAPVEVAVITTAPDNVPTAYRLTQNHPNPFNPKTNISFDLPEAQSVKLMVFAPDGRRIITLVSENMTAGTHVVTWNGRDENGASVASGVYFYRIDAGPLRQTSKMLLLK